MVLNVTAVPLTADTFVSVYPALGGRPDSSNVNTRALVTMPNQVTVKVGDNGALTLFNAAGSTHLIVDVAGWYGPGAGSAFVPVAPRRVLDTRDDGGPLPPRGGRLLDLQARGLPARAGAVVTNLTAVAPSEGSFLTAYPAGAAVPTASNVNMRPGVNVANAATVRTSSDTRMSLFNAEGTVHAITDLSGYFVPTA